MPPRPTNPPIHYRPATRADAPQIAAFVDYWLSGRGLRLADPGAVDDCFIPRHQILDYINRQHTLLAWHGPNLVAWAVLNRRNRCLLHLLVHGQYRRRGIATHMIHLLQPDTIRSKRDQATGNPSPFYKRLGYALLAKVHSKYHNPTIDLLTRPHHPTPQP